MIRPPKINKRNIFIVQFLDKMTWRDANKEYHITELLAYTQEQALQASSPDIRFRVRKFEEKE